MERHGKRSETTISAQSKEKAMDIFCETEDQTVDAEG